jgi:hypothetical protein
MFTMYYSEEVTDNLALQRAIKEIKKPNDKVEINNSKKKGKQKICVEIGSKKFSGEGETENLALKSVTAQIKNHKPSLIKRRLGKVIKSVNVFKRA